MSLVSTMGAVMIGDLVSTTLYGLTTHQVYVYLLKSWSKDPWMLKGFIILIWLLETIHTFLISASIFRWVILDFGDPAALLFTKPSDDVTTLITALIIFSIHLFYARRIWILSMNMSCRIILVGVVMILAICHFAFEIAVATLTFIYSEFSEFHKITAYYTASLAIAATCDLIIAASMWYLLFCRRTIVKSTTMLVNRIVAFSVMTGALTSIVDIAILICFVVMPDNLVYLSMYNFINNLYANSLIAMINAREGLAKISTQPDTHITLSNLHPSGTSAASSRINEDRTFEMSKISFAPQDSGSSDD